MAHRTRFYNRAYVRRQKDGKASARRVNSQLEKLRVKPRHDVGERRFQPGGLLRFLLFLAQAFREKPLFLDEAAAVFWFPVHSDQNLPARLPGFLH